MPEKRFENLLPATSRVRSVQDLHSFYAALSIGDVGEVRDASQLENEIETDFVEQLPYSGQSKWAAAHPIHGHLGALVARADTASSAFLEWIAYTGLGSTTAPAKS